MVGRWGPGGRRVGDALTQRAGRRQPDPIGNGARARARRHPAPRMACPGPGGFRSGRSFRLLARAQMGLPPGSRLPSVPVTSSPHSCASLFAPSENQAKKAGAMMTSKEPAAGHGQAIKTALMLKTPGRNVNGSPVILAGAARCADDARGRAAPIWFRRHRARDDRADPSDPTRVAS